MAPYRVVLRPRGVGLKRSPIPTFRSLEVPLAQALRKIKAEHVPEPISRRPRL